MESHLVSQFSTGLNFFTIYYITFLFKKQREVTVIPQNHEISEEIRNIFIYNILKELKLFTQSTFSNTCINPKNLGWYVSDFGYTSINP